jgi:hypothetical protein
MADGGLTIEIDEILGAQLKQAAAEAGRSAQDYASVLIAQGLADKWAGARASLAEYDQTGEFVDADEALSGFRAELLERLDRRR